MKFYKKISVTFLSAALTMLLIYGGYNVIYAEDGTGGTEEDGTESFEDSSMKFDDIKRLYHISMNGFFNEKLGKLVDLLDDEEKDPLNDPNFKAPEKVEDCGKDNVSTYCVAYEALDRYMRYIETLAEVRNNVFEITEGDQVLTANLLATLTANRNKRIDEEIDNAKMVMEATLDAYNEFRLAYPMHREYKKIINNLVKYRRELELIKRQARQFPLRFVDATTADCP